MRTSKHKINFGVALGAPNAILTLKKDNWKELSLKVESLGYSGIFIPDHFYPQWDPIAAMAGIAAITEHIDVGSMVCCVDYRHPIVFAKASATINLISNNRHIFGFGAGWMKEDYKMSGIPFDKAVTRIRRMEEAIKIIRGIWTKESTSFNGEHFQVEDVPKAVYELEYAKPRLMIGGGGKLVLKLAGKYADIANIFVGMQDDPGKNQRIVREGSFNNIGKKVERVRDSAVKAGRDPDELVYSQWIATRRMIGDPDEEKKKLVERFGVTLDEINDCTWIMAGEPSELVEKFKRLYDEFGISHFIIDGGDAPNIEELEFISKNIIKPLSKI